MGMIPEVRDRYFNLEVTSTQSCNMACTYCFEGEELKSGKKQNTESIPGIVSLVKSLFQNEEFNASYDTIVLNFWGGEATTNFNWNRKLIDALDETQYKDKIRYFIYTNGFNYDKVRDHIRLFDLRGELHRLKMQISWDGEVTKDLRVDHAGRPTFKVVKYNIIKLVKEFPDLNLGIKATIDPKDLLSLDKIWKDFYAFHKILMEIDLTEDFAKRSFSFAPTLNYIDDFTYTKEYLELVERQFLIITQYELAFHEKYQKFLFSWFGQPLNNDKNCSAGVNLAHISTNGEISPCHGVPYSPLKNDYAYANNQFNDAYDLQARQIMETRKNLTPKLTEVPDHCKGCSATVCYKCPIINVDQAAKKAGILTKSGLKYSQKTNGSDFHWTIAPYNDSTDPIDKFIVDNFQNRDPRHCEIYKLFGPIHMYLVHKLENCNTN